MLYKFGEKVALCLLSVTKKASPISESHANVIIRTRNNVDAFQHVAKDGEGLAPSSNVAEALLELRRQPKRIPPKLHLERPPDLLHGCGCRGLFRRSISVRCTDKIWCIASEACATSFCVTRYDFRTALHERDNISVDQGESSICQPQQVRNLT